MFLDIGDGSDVTSTDKIGLGAFLKWKMGENGLIRQLNLHRITGVELNRIIDENVTTIVEIQLCTATLDGRLSLDSANLPISIIGRNLLVSQFSILVEYTAIVFIAEGQDIHQADAAAGVAHNSSINQCLAFVKDSANLAGGVGKAENISNYG